MFSIVFIKDGFLGAVKIAQFNKNLLPKNSGVPFFLSYPVTYDNAVFEIFDTGYFRKVASSDSL
jgi:hypothetical protein